MFAVHITPNAKFVARRVEVSTIQEAKSLVYGVDKAFSILITHWDSEGLKTIAKYPGLGQEKWKASTVGKGNEKLLRKFMKSSYMK